MVFVFVLIRDPRATGSFKNFLMQGDLIVIAVGLVVAMAFSTLIKAFTDRIITPLVKDWRICANMLAR